MQTTLNKQTALVVIGGAFLGTWLVATAWSTLTDRAQLPAEPTVVDDRRDAFELDFVVAEADSTDTPTPESAKSAVPETIGATVVPTAVAAERREAMGGSRASQADLSASVLDPTASLGMGGSMGVDLSGLDGIGGTRIGSYDRQVTSLLSQYGRTDVRRCYEQRLKASPELRGTWVAELDVGQDGLVRKAVVRGTNTRDGVLARCIEHSAAAWRFPASSESVQLSKSFSLAPG